jgi:ankyrin repeat protein/serine/threonine protein kinase
MSDTLSLATATPADVDKMLDLGDNLQKKKTTADNAEALQWFLRAAEFDNAEAMCAVGHCFQIGLGVEKDNEKAMEWFRRADAKMDMKELARDGWGLFWYSSRPPCRVGVVAMFIAMGGDVNAVDRHGYSFLHGAAANGRETIVEMLIEAGADVNATDEDGRTPLHRAAANDRETTVEILIVAGADVNATDNDGSTPLHDAAVNGRETIVETLIVAGADVNATDEDGRTALHDAAANGRETTVEILIVTGADVKATDNDGSTALHDAAGYGYRRETIVEMLIVAGSDIKATDKQGRTPRDVARTDAIRELLDNAATRIDTCVVATMFDSSQSALSDARSARRRLASLDVIPPLLAAEGAFGTITAIGAIDFAGAERSFAEKQDALRSADQLLPEMITKRDEARQQLAQVAAAVIELHDSAPANWLDVICGRVAAAKAALASWHDDDSDIDDSDFHAWLSIVRRSAALKRSLTERNAEALLNAVQSFCAGAKDAHGEHVAAALARVRIASVLERRALDELRVPRAAFAKVVAQVDEMHAQVTRVRDVVDRAREVRAVTEPPNCARFESAQKNVAKLEKTIKLARVELEHPDDVDDLEATKEELRVAKVALVEARNESIAAVVELAAHSFDYPELRLLHPKARLDDLVVAGGDVSSLRTLDQYEDRVAIAKTRNEIDRASFNGVECALKLFRLVPANQRAFVKEARRLRQLAHPNIVEVRAVFVDAKNSVGVIEMPLYTHGDLWQWLAATDNCTVHDKLRVLRGALCGLEHVHRMGVVHADVKPENVFVDVDGVAKLGDFDVSKDDATRVTMAATIVSFSVAYAAPEVLRGVSASKAGDVYSFGLTMFDIVIGKKAISERPINIELLASHEPIEDGTALRDLARLMLDTAPERRISASDALKSALFAPPPPGRDAAHDRRECSVCCNTHWLDEGLSCSEQHFVCNGDLESLTKHFCSLSLAEIARRSALRCSEGGCKSAAWSNADLARALSEAQFAEYIDKLRAVSENRVLVEQQQRHQADLAQLERRLRGEMARDEEIAAHRRHITNDLLCLRCPRCEQVFVDFVNCFALTCGKCRAGFCAWCLHDCGEDAHRHVNNCAHNTTQPRSVFGTEAQFEQAQRERRANLVRAYLRDRVRNDDIRNAVRAAIQRELANVNVEI